VGTNAQPRKERKHVMNDQWQDYVRSQKSRRLYHDLRREILHSAFGDLSGLGISAQKQHRILSTYPLM